MPELPESAKMKIDRYYHDILIPANVALSTMRRNGLHVNRMRAVRRSALWNEELIEMERRVIDNAHKHKVFDLHYSSMHACLPDSALQKYLFEKLVDEHGEKLTAREKTDTGQDSTSAESLLEYAAVGPLHNVKNGKPYEDIPEVYDILKISSIAKARGTHLMGLLKSLRADDCAHAKQNWNLPNTTRISQEEPPLHQLPEHSDPEVAKLVKECITPRVGEWLGPPEEWDPRIHGWCCKVDVKGAEAVIRAGCIIRCRVSTPYLREGGDIHSKTASILYEVPEGTYKKGSPQREITGKQSYFRLIFGGEEAGMQNHLWTRGRYWLKKPEIHRLYTNFFKGYYDLKPGYNLDTKLAIDNGYIEDPYGRRWYMPIPGNVTHRFVNGEWKFDTNYNAVKKEDRSATLKLVEYIRHCYANRPTQSAQGTTTLWWLSLLHHGEYVELRTPDCWNNRLLYPEAAEWQINEGQGPGGKPFRVWNNNTVHDSGWFDGAPGTLTDAMKVFYRRANGMPAPFLLDANMPWRVEAEVGPDLGHLYPYNVIAKKFDLEPMEER